MESNRDFRKFWSDPRVHNKITVNLQVKSCEMCEIPTLPKTNIGPEKMVGDYFHRLSDFGKAYLQGRTVSF